MWNMLNISKDQTLHSAPVGVGHNSIVVLPGPTFGMASVGLVDESGNLYAWLMEDELLETALTFAKERSKPADWDTDSDTDSDTHICMGSYKKLNWAKRPNTGWYQGAGSVKTHFWNQTVTLCGKTWHGWKWREGTSNICEKCCTDWQGK